MTLFIEQCLNGFQFGLLLFLLAAGLTLVFGIMDLVNLAHGSLYMLGAYFAATFTVWTDSFVFGVVLAIAATLLVGMVVEVIATVEMPERDELEDDAEQQGGAERQRRTEQEVAGPEEEGRGEIGAHHVERAVRQVDEVHDAEHQRQSGGEQEQQQAELQSVQDLFDDEEHATSK